MDEENKPSPFEQLRAAARAAQEQHEQQADAAKMRAEYTALVIRHHFDSLTDEQLTVFTNLLAGLSNEGKHNYMASVMYGMAIGYTWNRAQPGAAPIPETDRRFGAFDGAIESMLQETSPEEIKWPVDLNRPAVGTDPPQGAVDAFNEEFGPKEEGDDDAA